MRPQDVSDALLLPQVVIPTVLEGSIIVTWTAVTPPGTTATPPGTTASWDVKCAGTWQNIRQLISTAACLFFKELSNTHRAFI